MHNYQHYALIGTDAVPVTLTANFTDNLGSPIYIEGFKKLALDWAYKPGENGAVCSVILEYSLEDKMSIPTVWHQFSTAIPATTEVDIYNLGGTGMGTDQGTPFIIPKGGASVAGTTYTPHAMPDTDLVGVWLRAKANETFVTTAGTLYLGGGIQA